MYAKHFFEKKLKKICIVFEKVLNLSHLLRKFEALLANRIPETLPKNPRQACV